MLSTVEEKCHGWLRTTNFFFLVYTGISWKMERWLMWKTLKHIYLSLVYTTMIDAKWRDSSYLLSVFRMMSEDGGGGRSKVL